MATRIRILILLGFLATVLAVGALIWKLKAGPAPEQANAVNPSSGEDARPTLTPNASPESSTSPVASTSPEPSTTPLISPSSTNPLASPSATGAPSNATIQPTPSPETARSPANQPSQVNAPSQANAQPQLNANAPASTPGGPESAGTLIIPVAGVRPDQLQDTFTAARSEGRSHDAIDIIAPKGTPVLAATNGPIIKLFLSKPGGITIYQLGTDNKTVYYYAHLDRYADGLTEGHFARQGETIAYVGDTGNAAPGNYHLHFSISLVQDPKRYWNGVNINPYPLLKK